MFGLDAIRPRLLRARIGLLTTATIALTALVPLAFTAGARAQDTASSADELTFWAGFKQVVRLSDADLDGFEEMGVDAFVMSTRQLSGFGNPAGDQEWTDDPDAGLGGSRYDFQRQLRDTRIVQRAAARGIDLYLGFYAVNYLNVATPYVDWFDDSGWATTAAKIGDLAGAAEMLGFRGLAIDQELYGQREGAKTATWAWGYPGNTHTESQVRSKAKQRGDQVMTAILDAFPGVEIGIHNFLQKDSWHELHYEMIGGRPYPDAPNPDQFGPRVDIDFWDGMTTVEGYSAIRQWNSVFYKDWYHGTAPTAQLKWENAMRADVSNTAALLSREFENWDYAHSRYFSSPFSWVNAGPGTTTWDDARPVPYVQTQLLAMRKFGMGQGFANYHYSGGLSPSTYSDYTGVLRTACSPENVDSAAPTVQVTASTPSIAGAASDDLAIWAVRWRDNLGGSGVARLGLTIAEGSLLNLQGWEMGWTLPRGELTAGASSVTVVAEDIKGNESAPAVIALGGADTTAPETSIRSRRSGRRLLQL